MSILPNATADSDDRKHIHPSNDVNNKKPARKYDVVNIPRTKTPSDDNSPSIIGIGCGFVASEEGYVVAKVIPGSMAELHALKVGDIVVELDGFSVVGMHPVDFSLLTQGSEKTIMRLVKFSDGNGLSTESFDSVIPISSRPEELRSDKLSAQNSPTNGTEKSKVETFRNPSMSLISPVAFSSFGSVGMELFPRSPSLVSSKVESVGSLGPSERNLASSSKNLTVNNDIKDLFDASRKNFIVLVHVIEAELPHAYAGINPYCCISLFGGESNEAQINASRVHGTRSSQDLWEDKGPDESGSLFGLASFNQPQRTRILKKTSRPFWGEYITFAQTAPLTTSRSHSSTRADVPIPIEGQPLMIVMSLHSYNSERRDSVLGSVTLSIHEGHRHEHWLKFAVQNDPTGSKELNDATLHVRIFYGEEAQDTDEWRAAERRTTHFTGEQQLHNVSAHVPTDEPGIHPRSNDHPAPKHEAEQSSELPNLSKDDHKLARRRSQGDVPIEGDMVFITAKLTQELSAQLRTNILLSETLRETQDHCKELRHKFCEIEEKSSFSRNSTVQVPLNVQAVQELLLDERENNKFLCQSLKDLNNQYREEMQSLMSRCSMYESTIQKLMACVNGGTKDSIRSKSSDSIASPPELSFEAKKKTQPPPQPTETPNIPGSSETVNVNKPLSESSLVPTASGKSVAGQPAFVVPTMMAVAPVAKPDNENYRTAGSDQAPPVVKAVGVNNRTFAVNADWKEAACTKLGDSVSVPDAQAVVAKKGNAHKRIFGLDQLSDRSTVSQQSTPNQDDKLGKVSDSPSHSSAELSSSGSSLLDSKYEDAELRAQELKRQLLNAIGNVETTINQFSYDE